MSERRLGDILRERRETLNLSIEEVAKVTKLKKSTILALESGNYKELQEPIYIKGFLKIYASILNLDYNKLYPILDKELKLVGKIEKEEGKNNKRLKFLFIISIVTIVVISIIVSLAYWRPIGFIRPQFYKVEVSHPVERPTEEKPLEESQSKKEKLDVAEVHSQVIPKEKQISIEVEGLDYSWLRVIVDGRKVFEGFLKSGDFYSWKGKERIIIRTGNAGGISIKVNGKVLGILGKKGEVLEREFLTE